MALHFLTSSTEFIDVVVTCDSSVEATEDQRSAYLNSGSLDDLGNVKEDATMFTLKALSPSEREEAEVRAGAYTRSELGRMLWVEAPSDQKARAVWHHNLTDEEREAMADYNAYLQRVYMEMIVGSLTNINGEEATVMQIMNIRPESNRVQAISELVMHIQRISLLGIEGKQHSPLRFGLVTRRGALGHVNNAKPSKD